MRLSLRSVGALTAAVLVAFAFWPDNRAVRGPDRVVAQEKTKAEPHKAAATPSGKSVGGAAGRGNDRAELRRQPLLPAPPAMQHPSSSDLARASKSEAQIREALNQPIDFAIEPQSLKDAISFIAARYQIPILFDQMALEDANVDTSSEVKLTAPGIPLHDALQLLLGQMSQPLGYDVVHRVLMISTVDKINEHLEAIVYDCRDLIKPPFFRMVSAAEDFWNTEESASELGGLLIVRQRREVHERIKALLASIRLMRREGAFAGLDTQVLEPNKREADQIALTRSKSPKNDQAVPQKRPVAVGFASVDHPLSSDLARRSLVEARIQQALNQPIDFVIEPQSLKDAIGFIATRYQIPILFEQRALDDANVDTSSEVELNVPGISLRDALQLLLDQMSQPLDYDVVHSVLMISTVDYVNEHLETIVYDCRDLINLPDQGSTAAGDHEQGDGATPGPTLQGQARLNVKSGPPEKKCDRSARRQAFVQMVKSATNNWEQDWEDSGPNASIFEMGGLLIVRQNVGVHERIKALLASIRLMRKEGAQPVAQDQADKPKVEKPTNGNGASARATDAHPKPSDESAAAVKERRSATHERPMSSDAGRYPRIEAALEETVNFKIEPQPLQKALNLLSSKFHVPVVLDQRALRDAKVDLKQLEVKLDVSSLTLRDTLDLILATQALGFEIRHGSLMVSTVERISSNREAVVYDCRDLTLVRSLDHIPGVRSVPATQNRGAIDGGLFGGGGTFQAPPDPARPAPAAPGIPQKPAEKAPPAAAPSAAAPAAMASSKIEDSRRLPLIRTIVSGIGDSWNEENTSITEFDGLLVVRQSQPVHHKIKTLLADIRRMRADGAFASFAKEYELEATKRAEQEAKTSAHGAK
jgi:hypothetical protein